MTDTPPLAGQVVVVAGTLSRLGRRELAALVERQLGRVQTTVTRDTTILVLGADVAAPAGTSTAERAAPSTSSSASATLASFRPSSASPGSGAGAGASAGSAGSAGSTGSSGSAGSSTGSARPVIVRPTPVRPAAVRPDTPDAAPDEPAPPPAAARTAGADSTPDTRRLADAQRLNARYPGRVRILSEREFFALAGLPSSAEEPGTASSAARTTTGRGGQQPSRGSVADPTAVHAGQTAAPAGAAAGADVDAPSSDESTPLYSSRALRGLYPALRDDHLRYLEQWGLVRPVRRTRQERFYRFADLAVIRQASAELARGHAFRSVLRGLVAEREGQLALDFQPPTGDAQPAKVITLTPRARPNASSAAGVAGAATRRLEPDAQTLDLAARYFAEGSELDTGDEAQQEAAMGAYRHAVMLDPGMVAALVNLANLYYARDAIVEAEALYEKALGLDDGCFEALFNLGNVHHDTGRFDEAVRRYEEALRIDPAYADAHFYLAVALEKLGRSADARPHWQAYQRLAPHGEWVELAKEFSSQG